MMLTPLVPLQRLHSVLLFFALVVAANCGAQVLDKPTLVRIERAHYDVFSALRSNDFSHFASQSSMDSLHAKPRLKKLTADRNNSIKVYTLFFADHDSLSRYNYYIYGLSMANENRSYIYYVAQFDIRLDDTGKVVETSRKLLTSKAEIQHWFVHVIMPYYKSEAFERPKDYPPPPPPPLMIDMD